MQNQINFYADDLSSLNHSLKVLMVLTFFFK